MTWTKTEIFSIALFETKYSELWIIIVYFHKGDPRGPFYHNSSTGIRLWTRNNEHYLLCDVITYP